MEAEYAKKIVQQIIEEPDKIRKFNWGTLTLGFDLSVIHAIFREINDNHLLEAVMNQIVHDWTFCSNDDAWDKTVTPWKRKYADGDELRSKLEYIAKLVKLERELGEDVEKNEAVSFCHTTAQDKIVPSQKRVVELVKENESQRQQICNPNESDGESNPPEKYVKNTQEVETVKATIIQKQNQYNSIVFNGTVTIKDRPTRFHQEQRSKFWFDYNTKKTQEELLASNKKRPGKKKTSFKDYIVNKDESDSVLTLLRKHINKDNPKQAALVILGGIKAGKIRQDVTAPSIEKEFGVNGNSVKPYLTNNRAKSGIIDLQLEAEIKPYIDFFCDKK